MELTGCKSSGELHRIMSKACRPWFMRIVSIEQPLLRLANCIVFIQTWMDLRESGCFDFSLDLCIDQCADSANMVLMILAFWSGFLRTFGDTPQASAFREE
jgi:hypothetical protein